MARVAGSPLPQLAGDAQLNERAALRHHSRGRPELKSDVVRFVSAPCRDLSFATACIVCTISSAHVLEPAAPLQRCWRASSSTTCAALAQVGTPVEHGFCLVRRSVLAAPSPGANATSRCCELVEVAIVCVTPRVCLGPADLGDELGESEGDDCLAQSRPAAVHWGAERQPGSGLGATFCIKLHEIRWRSGA